MNGLISLQGETYAIQILSHLSESDADSLLRQATISGDENPLPDNCRWTMTYGTILNYIVEQRPGIFPLVHKSLSRTYQVAFPWQYWVFTFEKSGGYWNMAVPSLAWSRNRVDSLTQRTLHSPNIPNVSTDTFEPCFGNTMPDSTLPPFKRVNEIVRGFYDEASVGNDDLDWHYPSDFSNAFQWAKASKVNPLGFMNWPELQNTYSRTTLRELLSSSEYDSDGNRINRDTTRVRSFEDVVNIASNYGERVW